MIKSPYFKNLLGGDLGFVVSFSHKASALGHHVVDVIPTSAKPQVVRSNAEPAIAVVENTQAFWNGSEVDYPRQPVGSNRVSVKAELAVSGILEHGSFPHPAPVGFWALNYSLPKALKNAIVDYHSSICAVGLQARRAFLI